MPNTLWQLETMYGKFVSEDLSQWINTYGYWQSSNDPFAKEIR